MFRVQPSHTIAVALLDHIRRKFEQGVRLQADLTRRNIGIVALQENIDTSEGSAAAKFFRRSALAQGAYQADSASELINLVLSQLGFGNCLRKRLRLLPFFRSVDVGGWQPWDENGMWSGWKGKNETSWND